MKLVLKLESLGLLILFSVIYFHFYPGKWGTFLAFFFVPDVSFTLYLINKKMATIAYNAFHHQGLLTVVLLSGFFLQNDWLTSISLIFLAHSTFDRMAGYGLKYSDNFDHTHLGWIGKSKHLNKVNL